MEASLGLGPSLTYRSSNRVPEIMALIRTDRRLRRRVDALLETCFHRAWQILTDHRPALEEIARTLRDLGRIGLEEIAATVESQSLDANGTTCPTKINLSLALRSDRLARCSEVAE
jgi:hypothetical protein